MTNEEKSTEIVKATSYLTNLTEYEAMQHCAMEMADFKDNQQISELGGWHKEPPTEDGCYLAETFRIPYKNCNYIVAEYDTNAQTWYDEAYENEIDIKRWKRI